MVPVRRGLILLPLLVAALGARSALAAERPNPYLAQARVYYLGLEYERCVERLRQAIQWRSSPAEMVDIEIYSGLCKFDLRQERAAADHFRMALRLNPDAKLPADTSPRIRRLFDSVSAQIPRALEPEKHADAKPPPKLTPTPPPPPARGFDLPNPPPARRNLVAPITLGSLAVATGVTALAFGLQARNLEQQANAAKFEVDAARLGNDAQRAAVVSNVSTGVASALAVSAILSYFLQPAGPQESK